jgi:uncharacterized integral membrane protein (TIGR00697 family)
MTTSTPSPETGPYRDLKGRVFLVLCALNVTALLVANMIGVKLFTFELDLGAGPFKVEHTAGMLAFPVTFLLTDLINEFYGRQAARLVAWLSFAMALIAFGLVSLARALPTLEGIPGTADEKSFELIFGGSSLMTLASIVAFLFGAMFDIAVFGFFKRLTRGRLVWLRATGSTLISQLLDSFIVTILFFQVGQLLVGGEVASPDFVLTTALTGYVLKFVLAVLLTPLIYLGRAIIRRGLGLEPIGSDEVIALRPT